MIKLSALTAAATQISLAQIRASTKPNLIVIMCDDMGFGDLQLYGNPVIRTPNINQMAREGTELTSFCASPLCSPTRGMLMTGRYPIRTGLVDVTGPGSPIGLSHEDATIAESLKRAGYRTAMFGKWHIGDFDTNPDFNPTKHGFDQFLGLPYSHDYNPPAGVPLYKNTEKVEQPVKFNLLTKRYTEEAIAFIKEKNDKPFFTYIAHNMPHIPIGTSDAFKGHSRAGRYGDVIEEIDWSVGEILTTVRESGKDRDTMIAFFSDNGPWAVMGEATYDRKERGDKRIGDVGWAGLLRGSKGTTYEGGTRVPCVFRWPGQIPAGRVSAELMSVMDIYGTFVPLAGGQVPNDRPFDGMDVSTFLKGAEKSPRTELFYYSSSTCQAVRQGEWKLRMAPEDAPAGRPPAASQASNAGGGASGDRTQAASTEQRLPQPLVTQLFNMDTDPSERFNLAKEESAVAEKLAARLQEFAKQAMASSRPLVAYRETVPPLD
jgi:arylsulfatase A-like enzyme